MLIPFDVMTARILHLFRWAKEKGMTLENIGRAEKQILNLSRATL
jgi:hypothetical protein